MINKKDHNLFTISSAATVKQAILRIEQNDLGTVIVVNHENKVVGSLTDGDIRKILIRGHTLLMPITDVMNTAFYFVKSGQEEQCQDIFAKHPYIHLIPVVDDDGVLISLCFKE